MHVILTVKASWWWCKSCRPQKSWRLANLQLLSWSIQISAKPDPATRSGPTYSISALSIFLEVAGSELFVEPRHHFHPTHNAKMGKEKGKKGRKDSDTATTKPVLTPKQTKSPNPAKQAKNLAAREKRAAAKGAMPTGPIEGFEDPNGRPGPFIQGPPHAKWPSMWKKDMGLIESRIKSLDRQMDAMRGYMQSMPEGSSQRIDYELGERSNWRHICSMMDRARELLCMVKEEARGILPQKFLDAKTNGGVVGMRFERLVPKLDAKAQELGYDPKGKGGPVLPGRQNTAADGAQDVDMSDSSDSSSDPGSSSDDEGDNITVGDDFVSLKSKKTRTDIPQRPKVEPDTESTPTANTTTDPSPMFFVDTEPTPVLISTVTGLPTTKSQLKKEKRAKLEEARAEKKAAKAAKADNEAAPPAGTEDVKPESKKRKAMSDEVVVEPTTTKSAPDVDLVALEAQLKADVDAATKAQAEAQEKAEKEKNEKKRRRRSSGADADLEVTKEKKVKIEKVKDKKRKAEDNEPMVEKSSKKKRKAEDEEVVVEEGSKKKSKKHKSAA